MNVSFTDRLKEIDGKKDVYVYVKSNVEVWWGIDGFNQPLIPGLRKKDFKGFKHLMIDDEQFNEQVFAVLTACWL